jgi:hypothetical protein
MSRIYSRYYVIYGIAYRKICDGFNMLFNPSTEEWNWPCELSNAEGVRRRAERKSRRRGAYVPL